MIKMRSWILKCLLQWTVTLPDKVIKDFTGMRLTEIPFGEIPLNVIDLIFKKNKLPILKNNYLRCVSYALLLLETASFSNRHVAYPIFW